MPSTLLEAHSKSGFNLDSILNLAAIILELMNVIVYLQHKDTRAHTYSDSFRFGAIASPSLFQAIVPKIGPFVLNKFNISMFLVVFCHQYNQNYHHIIPTVIIIIGTLFGHTVKTLFLTSE